MGMAPLIHDDFMLETPAARQLYHDYAAPMPIIDYHCHLSPAEVADDQRWENLTQVWLYGDHYKWRQMRTNGVAERYCTGDASDWEKFEQWAAAMPYLLRNPLWHWTHLELARYFGISDRLLCPETAAGIWEEGAVKLAAPKMSARGLMQQSRVVLVCTTDDPTDDLGAHRRIAADARFEVQVLPTWRPDRAMDVSSPPAFNAWVDRLAAMADVDIGGFPAFLEALHRRHAFFHEQGCRLSDRGLDTVYFDEYTDSEISATFAAARAGRAVDRAAARKFQSAMLYEFAKMDAARGWTQQIHYGAMRNNCTRLFERLGRDIGCDSIGDWPVAVALSRLLDRLDREGQLPKTILYNLNPRDNALLTTIIGNFQDGSVPGKLQHGSAWWFLDHKVGMEDQLETLSATGLLSRFVGMLTDSRSFLSYTRHEYFRRLLCNLLGNDITKGLLPNDMALVGRLVRDVSYNNAARYFGFDVPVLDA